MYIRDDQGVIRFNSGMTWENDFQRFVMIRILDLSLIFIRSFVLLFKQRIVTEPRCDNGDLKSNTLIYNKVNSDLFQNY